MTFIPAVVAIAGEVIPAIAGPSPDADRFAKTAGWYRDALAGDDSDACRLKYYSGRFGSHDCGTGVISGWATQPAKDYSYLLWNQLQAVRAGQIPASTPVPSPQSIPSVANTAATISEAAGAVSVVAGQVAGSYGVPTTAQRVTQAAEVGKWLLVGGFVLVVGYIALRAFRR